MLKRTVTMLGAVALFAGFASAGEIREACQFVEYSQAKIASRDADNNPNDSHDQHCYAAFSSQRAIRHIDDALATNAAPILPACTYDAELKTVTLDGSSRALLAKMREELILQEELQDSHCLAS